MKRSLAARATVARRLAPVVALAAAGCVPLQPVTPASVEPATPVVVQSATPAAPAVTPAPAPVPVVTPAPAVVAQPAPASPETLRALEELTELKEELRHLLNAVEEIQFDRDREAAERETARWQQQNLFQDLDRRLLKLERDARLFSQPAPPPATPPSAPPAAAVLPAIEPLVPDIGDSAIALDISGGGPADTAALGDGAPATITVGDAAAAGDDGDIVGDAGDAAGDTVADTVTVQEQVAYDRAFALLKQSRYDDAIAAFGQLADTWPNGQLADDALYWKSEAQYVNREYEAALQGFEGVVARYPDSSRLPEALLKTGTIRHEIGAYPEAERVFRDILQRFPDHQVGTMARLRLGRAPYTTQ